MSFGSTVISLLRKKGWRRSQYDINELCAAEVTCLSLTDLSNLPPRYRNTFDSCHSAENLLNSQVEWKRKSLNLSLVDSVASPAGRDSMKSRRPHSCYIDYSCNTPVREMLSVTQKADDINSPDSGYDSMNASSDSVLSLVRSSSIQDKSRRLMLKRHQFVKKRSRDSQVFSDDENEDKKYSKSNCEKQGIENERKNHKCENRISVHFEEFENEESNDKSNKESNDKSNNKMTKSVSTMTLCRNNSVQLKSWQIRRQRRAMFNKHKKAIKAIRLLEENVKHEERLV